MTPTTASGAALLTAEDKKHFASVAIYCFMQ